MLHTFENVGALAYTRAQLFRIMQQFARTFDKSKLPIRGGSGWGHATDPIRKQIMHYTFEHFGAVASTRAPFLRKMQQLARTFDNIGFPIRGGSG